jgi:hypothetical protein
MTIIFYESPGRAIARFTGALIQGHIKKVVH